MNPGHQLPSADRHAVTFDQLVQDCLGVLASRLELHPARIFIVHHGDTDGCVAAVYMHALLKRRHNLAEISVTSLANHDFTFSRLVELVKEGRPNLLITLDLPVHQEPDVIELIDRAGCATIMYDHHVQQNPGGRAHNITEINPLQSGLPDHPTSYFGYNCFHTALPDERERLWLLGVGLVGDYSLHNYPDIVSRLSRSQSGLLQGYDIHDPASAYRTVLGRIASRINAGFRYQPGSFSNISFQAIRTAFESDNPLAFFSTDSAVFGQLGRIQENLSAEIDREMADHTKLAKRTANPPLFFYLSSSPHFIAGVLASLLARDNPSLVCVVGFRQGDVIQCELRRGARLGIDLTDILRRQSAHFRCISCGGHPAAAGALVAANQIDDFYSSFALALQQALEEKSQ